MNKETVKQAANLGERLFIDISLTEHKSYGKAKFWLLVVDDVTNFCWSFFLKSKSKIKTVMITLIKELNDRHKIKVERICCNNSGENHSFHQAAKQESLGNCLQIHCEEDATTKQMHEWKFATLFGHIHAMLNGAGFVEEHETL